MNKKAKVRLLSASFDHEGAEVSYTTPDVGGAASLKNAAYMFKSIEQVADKESQIGDNTGKQIEDETLNEEQKLIKQLQDELAQLKAAKELEDAIATATTEFAKVLGEDEVVAELAAEFNTTEQVEVIVKALSAVKVAKEAEITKALESEESELQKALSEEAGHTEQQEAPVAKTLVQKAIEQKTKGEK